MTRNRLDCNSNFTIYDSIDHFHSSDYGLMSADTDDNHGEATGEESAEEEKMVSSFKPGSFSINFSVER